MNLNITSNKNILYQQTCITSEKLNNNYTVNFHMNPKLQQTENRKPQSISVTSADLNRMRGKEALSSHQDNRLKNKEISEQKVRNWPNTLQANRKRKDAMKYETFKNAEEERRRTDYIEAQLLQDQKKHQIKNSNIQIFKEKDNVKQLNHALMISDAHQVRNQQIEIQDLKNKNHINREAQFHQMLLDNQQEFDKKQDKLQSIRQQKVENFRTSLNAQQNQNIQNYMQKIQEDIIEGEIIKVNAQKALENERQQILQKKINQKNIQNLNQNENVKTLEHKELMKSQDADILKKAYKEQEIYDQRTKLVKHQFHNRIENKNVIKNQLIETQTQTLKEQQQFKDDLLEQQILKKEKEYQQKELVKKEKLIQSNISKENDRQDQIKNKQMQKQIQQQMNLQYQIDLKKHGEDIWNREVEVKQKQKEFDKYIHSVHVQQKNEKDQIRQSQVFQDFQHAEEQKNRRDMEDEQYRQYCNSVIQEYQSAGKDIKPILLCLKKQNKI